MPVLRISSLLFLLYYPGFMVDRFYKPIPHEPQPMRAREIAKDLIRDSVRRGTPIEELSGSYFGHGYKGNDVGIGHPIFYHFGQPDQKRIPVSSKQISVHLDEGTDVEYFQVFPLPTLYKEIAKEEGVKVPQPQQKKASQTGQENKPASSQPLLFGAKENVAPRKTKSTRRTVRTKGGDEINQMSMFEDIP
ncbi:MAG: hypothetical protein ACYDER_16410 [Ktedonobacteraceae bacterium]